MGRVGQQFERRAGGYGNVEVQKASEEQRYTHGVGTEPWPYSEEHSQAEEKTQIDPDLMFRLAMRALDDEGANDWGEPMNAATKTLDFLLKPDGVESSDEQTVTFLIMAAAAHGYRMVQKD